MFSKSKEKTPHAAEKTPPCKTDESVPPADGELKPETQAEDARPPADEAAATPCPSSPAPAPAPTPDALELAALKDRHARLMADFDNFRKRQLREREEWIKRANESLLGDLLPIVDHLELALQKVEASDDPFAVGVKLVYDQFAALLARYDMTPIDAKGQPFDPNIHEALSQMNSATVPDHVVIDQFRRGWRLAGKLLRPAQVIVSSGAPEPETASAESASVSD